MVHWDQTNQKEAEIRRHERHHYERGLIQDDQQDAETAHELSENPQAREG